MATEKQIQKEKKRVENALKYILAKVTLDNFFIIEDITADEKILRESVGHDCGILEVSRTNRGTSDKPGFIIYFDPETTKELSTDELRKAAFHELLHVMTFPYLDEIENLLTYISNNKLKTELAKRADEVSENCTYNLERTFGKLIFPSLDWNTP